MCPVGEGFDKGQDLRRRFPGANFINNGRADNCAIGHRCDVMRILRGANSKANDDGQIGGRFDARDFRSHIGGLRRRRARDAIDGDIIDKARGVGEHFGQALVIGGGCGQANKVQAGLLSGNAQLAVLFRRQINHNHPVDAGLFGLSKKPRHAA